MLEAFHRLGDDTYLEAAKRGGDFLVLAQLPEPQPGWAQQYNFDMEITKKISPDAFFPKPESYSAILIMRKRKKKPIDDKPIDDKPINDKYGS